MIRHLQSEFPNCLIGLSDHTMNLMTPVFAYMLGANICEKHYTVDKTLDKSADHWFSVEPSDVEKIIESYKLATTMLGSIEKECTLGEERAKLYARRSVVLEEDIKVGEEFTFKNLTCKRPGTGISPKYLKQLVGKKSARNLQKDYILKMSDVLQNHNK